MFAASVFGKALNNRVWVQTANSTYEYLYDYTGRRISSWLQPGNEGNGARIYWDNQVLASRAANGYTYFEGKSWWVAHSSAA